MPPANVKIQLEMRIGSEGFSEIYYRSGTKPKDEAGTAQALADERKKLLVQVGVIHHARISAAQPGGRSYRMPIINGQGAYLDNSPRDVGNVTNTVGVYTSGGAYRKLKFHGRPDRASLFNTDGTPIVTLDGTIKTFLDYLKSQSYQIRSVGQAANDDTLKSIDSITVAEGVVTFLVDTTGLSKKQHIKISGCKGYKVAQFNGTWVIGSLVSGPPTAFTASTKRLIDPKFQYVLSSGKIRNAEASSYAFAAITDYDNFEGVGTRKVGRPTDSPRGRVSSRR